MILTSTVSIGVKDIQSLTLTAISAQTRRQLADSFLQVMNDVKSSGGNWAELVSGALEGSFGVLRRQPLKASIELHGAALLGGTCVHLCRVHPEMVTIEQSWGLVKKILTRLGEGLMDADDSIGNVFADAIALAASGHSGAGTLDRLRIGWVSVVRDLTKSLNKFGNGDRVNAPRSSKVVEPTGLVLGVVTPAPEEDVVGARLECTDALFKLLGSDAFRKDEEIALAVGEALAVFSQAQMDAAITMNDVLPWPDGMDEDFAKKSSPPVHVLFSLLRLARTTRNNHKRRSCAAALFAVVASATSPNASDVLLCVQNHLHEILDCFLFLLGDSKGNQLSRESCCLGLAACNKLVVDSESNELNGRLLRAFGATTNHGTSAMQETPQQAAQRRQAEGSETSNGDAMSSAPSDEENVGGAAGVSEASLGAYREMAAAAVASGRPDILYSMLILSVSHPIWTSTQKRRDAYGSIALQGGTINQDELKSTLRPYLSRLLPRILRAMHE
jgi:hypothetical protein